MLNRVILIGRLTDHPGLSYTKEKIPFAKFTLAVGRNYENRKGKKETDFIQIKAWRKLAEHCAKHLDKGRLVAVEGRIESTTYKDMQGNPQKSFGVLADDVRFLDWPKDKDQGQMEMYPDPEIQF